MGITGSEPAQAAVAGLLFIGAVITPQFSAAGIIKFDPPNSVQTNPKGINTKSWIASVYYKAGSGNGHGFVRGADGTITVFNVSGASCGTYPFAINKKGSVTGVINDGGGAGSHVGGLIGMEARRSHEAVEASYATGSVSGGPASRVGGFIGVRRRSKARFSATYWDVQTSGTSQATGKGFSHGIFGETTEQLQSDLPKGFAPDIWTENSNINGGLPYLIANPPPK